MTSGRLERISHASSAPGKAPKLDLYSAHRENLTSEALRHGSHIVILQMHSTCFYHVSVHQTALPLT